MPAEEAGRTGEALELHERQRPVGAAVQAHHRAQLGQRDLAHRPRRRASWRVMRAAAECVATTSRPPATGSACWMTPAPSATSVVHPSGGTSASRGIATTRPAWRVERRDGHQAVARRTGRTSPRRRPATSVLHSPARSSRRCRSVRAQPTSTVTSVNRPSGDVATSAHASGVGSSPHTSSSSAHGSPQPVPVDAPVVLVAGRVAGVEEGGSTRQPGHAGGAGLGDLVAQVLAGVDVEDPQDAALVTTLRHAVGHEPAVQRRVVPVDGGRRVGRQRGRVDQEARRARPASSTGRTTSASCFWPPPRSSENTRSPARRTPVETGQPEQADEALEPRPAVGPGIERLAGAFVLGRDPRRDLGRVAVLQPSVRIGDRVAVEHVDRRLPPRRRRRRHARRRSAPHVGTLAVVGLGAPHAAPSASSSSWT